jgi:hypothetical protein
MLLLPAVFAQTSEFSPPDARFALALYCNPTCSDEVLEQLELDLSSIRGRSGFSEQMTRPGRIMGMADSSFGIPDEAFIEAYGVEVDRPESLIKSESVVLGWFASPTASAQETLAIAHAAFGKAAEASGGWVEDLDTQALYGAAAWKAHDPMGPVTEWMVVDGSPLSEAEDAPLRMITRGMRRFGLPELVVEEVSMEGAGDVAVVMNAVAETFAKSGPPSASSLYVEYTGADGTTVKGTANFSRATRQDEDPDDPLLKLSFDGEIIVLEEVAIPDEPPPEPTPEPLASTELKPLSNPPPAPQGPPTSLQEAQALAASRLEVVVRPAFTAGFPTGEVLAVSVPFETTSGGLEYMWVEITAWNGTELTGVLANQPLAVLGLNKGDTIKLQQSDIFDYVWKKADGSREGNFTAHFVSH